MSISVSELTNRIKKHLEPTFKGVTVQGEISNFKAQASGHYYFTLKDEASQLSVSFFNAARYKLPRVPKDGDKVIITGDINIYAPRGNYQLVAQGLIFTGVGDLLLKLHQLKLEIKELGWFDKEWKKPLPSHPKKIGVITSPTGAVIQDIIHVLNRRIANFHLILYPVKVQGEGAKEEIALAINEMNRYQICDVLIVGRGGGSIEDLWAFNEKIVAKSIFDSQIPIVAAIGHETDFTIADFVADVRAPTPSAAAEMVCTKTSDILDRLKQFEKRLDQIIKGISEKVHLRLEQFKKQPALRGIGLLHPFLQRLDHMCNSLDLAVQASVLSEKNRLELLAITLQGFAPQKKLRDQKAALLQIEQAISSFVVQLTNYRKKDLEVMQARLNPYEPSKKLQELKERHIRMAEHLKSLNPKTILKRGFCIPQNKKGAIIRSVEDISLGENINLIFYNGTIGAHVDGVRSSLQET
ncbi:MAG: exodeoxyribonuclease VII large subunit [Chlamydiae bacterium]|nr:exodeoxyribonuclease VII large subunit [Chlamydiota bacterium]